MNELISYLEKNNIDYDQTMIDKFSAYRRAILAKNEHINLTAIRDPQEFTQKHFVDSAACCGLAAYERAKTIFDVGTGAGFPGVPLAILSPQKSFVLIDSLRKRLKVVEEICEELGIDNVKVVHGRAEDLGRQPAYREQADLCLSRAVANLATLCELCLPLVKVGGTFAAYKGAGAEDELKRAGRAISLLGGAFRETIAAPLDAIGDEHKLILIEKTAPTGSKYPRKAGTPAKEPL